MLHIPNSIRVNETSQEENCNKGMSLPTWSTAQDVVFFYYTNP